MFVKPTLSGENQFSARVSSSQSSNQMHLEIKTPPAMAALLLFPSRQRKYSRSGLYRCSGGREKLRGERSNDNGASDNGIVSECFIKDKWENYTNGL